MDRKIRYFVNGWSFRLSFATRPGYDGDHEDISDGDSYELGEYENSEEALAAAEAFISTHGNEVNDEEDGIGSVIYWTVEVERRVEYKENEWLPCDESGRIDDGYGNEPNATVAYLSSLRSREDGMHLRGDSVREIPFMLFLGLLFAVTVGWWVFLTLTVSVVFGNVAAAVFAVCSALSVTVGYGLVRASDSRE